jgi:hypothetical protein
MQPGQTKLFFLCSTFGMMREPFRVDRVRNQAQHTGYTARKTRQEGDI